MDFASELLMSGFVTHDVRRLLIARPEGFAWKPGQGIELAIDEDGWRDEARPFTPSGLEQDRVLELTIKGYPDHEGVTERLHALEPGARLLLSEPFGTITYRGPGVFIAGGAGVTPFLAILRRLARDGELQGHRLIFSNRTAADVICEKELRHLLGADCHLLLTREDAPGYARRRIDRRYLGETLRDFEQKFYVCGPPAFVDEIKDALSGLGASPEALIFEE